MTTTTFAAPAQVAMTPAVPTVATGAPAEAVPTDFLLMLGQLVAASAEAAPAVAASMATQPEPEFDTDEATDTTEASAGILNLLPLPLPQPVASSLPATSAEASDMIMELELSRQAPAAARIDVLSRETGIATELAEPSLGSDGAEAPTTTFETMLSAPAGKEPLQSHRAINAEVSRPVHSPVGSQAWADDIGARVTMMAKQGEQTASLRLSPEHLGPLEIRVAIRDEQASVWFGAAHADTRAAIENALPRLRELFESQGMSLTDAGVFQESPRQQAMAHSSVHGIASEDLSPEPQTASSRTVIGLIDAYA